MRQTYSICLSWWIPQLWSVFLCSYNCLSFVHAQLFIWHPPPILNGSLKSVMKIWKHLLSFNKVALKILALTHIFSRACCSLFLTHSISTKRECNCNGTEAEDRSSNLVTHHMTATVSHSLTQSYHLTKSNLLTWVQLKMPSSTTW